ncbi:MAG TPA: ABC transporter ATP-binding protein [Casimicrobiaceae bacterium]|nr:ABC transporter ATP-binding protein [Casimicrobiaceae bacterium]
MVAARIENVGKRYEIYERPHHRLLQTLFRGRRTYYREFWALRNVTFDVARGETVGIVGRNGSGKSTLLQLVAGTLTPTTGSISTRGRIAALLELGSGFNPEFTGRENVYLNGAILGLSRAHMHGQFDAIAEFAGIGDFIDQPVKMYSSGMMVRLAFAVAVHVTPDLLIVDEALAVGDTPFQAKCLQRIRAMQQSGVSILLVTHSPNAVIEFCERAIYLDRGRLVASGPSREIVERYADDVVAVEGGIAIATGSTVERVQPPRLSDVDDVDARSEFIDVSIAGVNGDPKAAFRHGEIVVIEVGVRFRRANAAPCFGIQLKSTDDIVLWSATTQQLGVELDPVAAPTTLRFAWQLRASFGGGRYVVALGVGDVESGEYHRHSRAHYAAHFDVLPERHAGGGWLAPDPRFVSALARTARERSVKQVR